MPTEKQNKLPEKEVFPFINEIGKFNVFTLSDTWLNSSITDLELEIPGYDLYQVDRNTKSGGGVGV